MYEDCRAVGEGSASSGTVRLLKGRGSGGMPGLAAIGRHRMKTKYKIKNLWTMVPLLILAALFIFLPILSMIKQSFMMPETGTFTLNNYKTIFTDSVYRVATENSLYLSFLSTIIGLILSFLIAYSINELGQKGQGRILSLLNMVSNFAGLPLYFSFVVILAEVSTLIQWKSPKPLKYKGFGLLCV